MDGYNILFSLKNDVNVSKLLHDARKRQIIQNVKVFHILIGNLRNPCPIQINCSFVNIVFWNKGIIKFQN